MPRRPFRLDRRAALKGLGAAAVSPWLPGCPPAGDGPPPADLLDLIRQRVDTVVVLMMENRSFDHYFGALSLEEGRTDVDGLLPGMSNPHPAGGLVEPYAEDDMCVYDPPHGWDAVHNQWNGGEMDGFVAEYAAEGVGDDGARKVMGYFGRKTLPASYAIADRHVLCQRWFCSVLGPTWPNRFYSHAASSNGATSNDPGHDYEMPTIYDRLTEAGVSWRNFYATAPFMLLLPNHFSEERFRGLEDFYPIAAGGGLPSVSILEPFYGRNDDHPPTHPVAGQILISSIYRALAQSPQWDRCLFLVTYDEHGGFFDHALPPTTPDPFAAQGFDRMGIRVPAIVAGPWMREGHVSSTVFDHTSIPALIEAIWDLEPLNERDAAANDLSELFDADRLASGEPAPPADVPVIEADEEEIYAEECSGGGIARDVVDGPFHMAQPEFEHWLDTQLPSGHPADRRAQTGELLENWMRIAEDLGAWRRR